MKVKCKKEINLWVLDRLPLGEVSDVLRSFVTPEMENPLLIVSTDMYNDSLGLYIIYEREETAYEKAKRIKEEERKIAAKQKEKEKERKLYERLRKKYET